MRDHPMLFAPPPPPGAPEGIDLRRGSLVEILEHLEATGERPHLTTADPPWLYGQRIGASAAADHYGGLPIPTILEHLERSAALSPRLALWHTWPIMTGDWPDTIPGWGRPVTGGTWTKSGAADSGHYGPGYHWSGCSEPVLIYTKTGKGSKPYTDRAVPLRNAWISPPGQHSRKPVQWMRQWIRRWTPPGGLVFDMYAGLGSVAEACYLERRRYIGAELDPDRHARALTLLARSRAYADMGL